MSAARRYKRYPRIAMDNNWEGKVEVRMVVGANGMISSITIRSGTGHEVLDQQALDMIRKNNLELMKGVDRATTTTVSALRTAVIVAQALANQKLVLDQITALNTTTGNLIAGTSEMLRDQSAAIHQQAASSTIDIAKLQLAFQNIYQTMDTMADFKVKALASMQTTVDTLTDEVAKSRTYLDRVRGQESAQALSTSTGVQL